MITAKAQKHILSRITIVLISTILCILLVSCSGNETGTEVPNTPPTINVYIPDYNAIVTVEYDQTLGKLVSLEESLKSTIDMYGDSTDLVFLGLYDMAEGGNIVYNSQGFLHSDYVFTEGVTLFAQYKEVIDEPATYYFVTLYKYEKFDKRNEGTAMHKSIKKTAERVYLGSAPLTINNSQYFIGWAGATSGKVITNRSGYVIDGYDLFTSGESEFYPVYATSKVVCSIFHTDSGDVEVEAPISTNLTDKAPTDDNGTRQIIGWSTDPKAKYVEDIEYPTYRGEDFCNMPTQKEGAEYYPIYSEYKEIKIVYKGYSETTRIFKKCTDSYGYLTLSEYVTFKNDNGFENFAIAAYISKEGKAVGKGTVSYQDVSSEYTVVRRYTKAHYLTLLLVDSKKGTETKYIFNVLEGKAYVNIPVDDPDFIGWFNSPDSTDSGVIEYIRFEPGDSHAYVKYKNKDKEVLQSIGSTAYISTQLTLYAIYREESEGSEQ